ncbi:MAG: hypothetical protein N3G21_10840 [Candidatus Hydrogenedentes bacterium]|nr:hypothetical protein [Candidatus Hydrogenedentota bacterium]
MQKEDRPIHFSVELIHPPFSLNKEAIQKLYTELLGTKAKYDSIDLSFPMQARFYTNHGNKSQSIILFLPDRALITEEWTIITFSDFLEKTEILLPKILKARNQSLFLAHIGTIRSTFGLTGYQDAKTFIVEKLLHQTPASLIDYFGRSVSTVGIRFVFPESNETPGLLHIAIESFRHNKKEVFVEVRGIFSKHPITPNSVKPLLENLKALRDFLTNRVQYFLSQFD